MARLFRPGWVYILTNDTLRDGIVKIGRTEVDCEQRLLGVRSMYRLPGKWTLEWRVPVIDAVEAEKAAHAAYADKRIGWEFFEVSVTEAKARLIEVVTTWRCDEDKIGGKAPPEGWLLPADDRRAKWREAAAKAVLTAKRRAAARKAWATIRARQTKPSTRKPS